MLERFNRDMELQDKIEIQRTLDAVLYGRNNKKRTRGDAFGIESEEQTKKKIRRLNAPIHSDSEDDEENFGKRIIHI